MIDITKLAANLKPKDNALFMKIAKGIKDAIEKQMWNNEINDVRAAMTDNASDLKRYCTKNASSIIKNTPTPKCVNCGHMVNVSAEEPATFDLLMGSPIAIIDPCDAEEEISKMTNNVFGNDKGLQKNIRSLA